jgi:hypothetical protein
MGTSLSAAKSSLKTGAAVSSVFLAPLGPGSIRLLPVSFEQKAPRAAQRPGHSVTSLRAISRLPAKAYRAPAEANG